MSKGQKLTNWLYDPKYDFFDNLKKGPSKSIDQLPPYINRGEPKYEFFGLKVYSPFGIAAGPLPKAEFISSALNRGYDIVTFKSVRTGLYPSHPLPNVLPLSSGGLDPKDTDKPILLANEYAHPLSLANSFGIPSFTPEIWQGEMKKSFQLLGKGQAMLAAFQGTVRDDGHEAFINDHVKGVGLLKETGANIVEINLSCPNEGSKTLLCFDIQSTSQILKLIRKKYPSTKLIIKIAYFNDKKLLHSLIKEIGDLVDGITAINTVGAKVVDETGKQAFPGSIARLKPGISGKPIRHLGLEMVKNLKKYRGDLGLNYKIIGVGGVLTAQDYHEYRSTGADYVMGLTGVMWNPNLAAEIKASL
jgi:dihydroorotate dehydrogenase (NAD+) catalytic subunit